MFVCGLLLLTSLLPLRLSGWVSALRDPVMVLVAPVSTPMASVQRWLRPGGSRTAITSEEEINQIRDERERFRALYLSTLQENDDLRMSVRALQAGMDAVDRAKLLFLEASNTGYSPRAGSIDISRGSAHGVRLGAAATARNAPQHLVGLVSSVGTAVSTVHLLTDTRLSPGLVEAIILSDELVEPDQVRNAPRVQFQPTGKGTLEGDVGIDSADRVNPGDLAFLDDPHWPLSAQRLILGRVIQVRSEPDRPLFRTVVIRPEIDPARVAGVILRIPREVPLTDVSSSEGDDR